MLFPKKSEGQILFVAPVKPILGVRVARQRLRVDVNKAAAALNVSVTEENSSRFGR